MFEASYNRIRPVLKVDAGIRTDISLVYDANRGRSWFSEKVVRVCIS